MGIQLKSPREIELMRQAGNVVSQVFIEIKRFIVPGVDTAKIASIAEKVIRKHGATPTFLNYEGYPGAICISVNDVMVHGIPSKTVVLKSGDIVSLDVGATLNGYVGDACRTFLVGECSEVAKKIVEVTEKSFFEGVSIVKPGIHLGDVSARIQEFIEQNGFSVNRQYTGHGVGTHLHEDPIIPNYGKAGTGVILVEGMCLAIEPMVCEGKPEVEILEDGWTARTIDGKLSSHYENTIAVTKDGFEILTLSDGERR